ncbi:MULTISPECIES: hypothetical protein [unclassified Paenibacillus]|uniref:hypothetical protein n=1 Tax=unclassified Paenibacillus TaxID=185978 RepID=UPI00034E18F7|nr:MULTISPECIES: hypothetical protein [unclassified Paenibacillus]EPD90368.1 hypothetical protein HMPREF1207_01154 [Paenibacillus sp. HGH0039]
MSDEPQQGQIRFYDHDLPGLPAGNYKVTVKQSVQDIGITAQEQALLMAEQPFIVHAPQFAIDPSEIHSLVPPAGSTGKFADELPHLVLNTRVLPWEREMSGPNIPWLALLLFQEEELLAGPADRTDAETLAIRSTAGEFMGLKNSPDVYVPQTLVREADVTEGQTCFYIQMDAGVFQSIIPQLNELPYLTHVRQVNTQDKAAGHEEDGWYSVVTGNRFPYAQETDEGGSRNIVHLVSLEKFDDLLQPGAKPPKEKIALLSLARWTFRCRPDSKEDFAGLMHRLVAEEMSGAAYDPGALLLRLPQGAADGGEERTAPPDDAAGAEARKRLRSGYVPLPFHIRSGEDTFAWYRGPLAPVRPASFLPAEPLLTADAALIYDKANGLFDASLAAAWQIGRSLALSDATFGSLLLDYRRRCHRLTDLLYHRLEASGLTDAADLKELAQSGLMREALLGAMKGDLLEQIPEPPLYGLPQDSPQQNLSARRQLLQEGSGVSPVAALQQFLAGDEVKEAVAELTRDDLEPIALWLAYKLLLYDVPFYYLVPEERMLPSESIRFFYLDSNWLDAMLDGMLAIAMHSSRDSFTYGMTKGTIRAAAEAAAQTVRTRPGDGRSAAPGGEALPLAGFLLRSAAVAGWPGLAVRAFDAVGLPLGIARLERLSSSVLLALFRGIPDRIELSEPQEGFQFGLNEEGEINLRSVLPDRSGSPFGSELNVHLSVRDRHLRPGRVLDLRPDQADGLVQQSADAIKQALKLDQLTLNPSDFALQIVKSPERIVFQPGMTVKPQ